MTDTRLQSGDIVSAIFEPRVMDDLKPLIGWRGAFEALWTIEVGPYCGEWAMKIPSDWPIGDTVWVPEGDLTRVDA